MQCQLVRAGMNPQPRCKHIVYGMYALLQGGEAARQMRNAPQPKYWGGPANRSGHLQVQAQEALAHESPLMVSMVFPFLLTHISTYLFNVMGVICPGAGPKALLRMSIQIVSH